jgi:hypothetical protein
LQTILPVGVPILPGPCPASGADWKPQADEEVDADTTVSSPKGEPDPHDANRRTSQRKDSPMKRTLLLAALAVALVVAPATALANEATPADHFTVSFSSSSLFPFTSSADGNLALSSLAVGAPVTGTGTITLGDADTGTVYRGSYTATQLKGVYDFDAARVGGGSFHSLVNQRDPYGAAVTLSPSTNFQNQDLWLYCGNARSALDIGITLDSPVSTAAATMIKKGGRLYSMPLMTGTVKTTSSFC